VIVSLVIVVVDVVVAVVVVVVVVVIEEVVLVRDKESVVVGSMIVDSKAGKQGMVRGQSVGATVLLYIDVEPGQASNRCCSYFFRKSLNEKLFSRV